MDRNLSDQDIETIIGAALAVLRGGLCVPEPQAEVPQTAGGMEADNDRLRAENRALAESLAASRQQEQDAIARCERLQHEVKGLDQSLATTRSELEHHQGYSECIWCGFESEDDKVRDHMHVCLKHPMRAVEAERDKLTGLVEKQAETSLQLRREVRTEHSARLEANMLLGSTERELKQLHTEYANLDGRLDAAGQMIRERDAQVLKLRADLAQALQAAIVPARNGWQAKAGAGIVEPWMHAAAVAYWTRHDGQVDGHSVRALENCIARHCPSVGDGKAESAVPDRTGTWGVQKDGTQPFQITGPPDIHERHPVGSGWVSEAEIRDGRALPIPAKPEPPKGKRLTGRIIVPKKGQWFADSENGNPICAAGDWDSTPDWGNFARGSRRWEIEDEPVAPADPAEAAAGEWMESSRIDREGLAEIIRKHYAKGGGK